MTSRRHVWLLLAATLLVKGIVLAQLHDHPLLQPQGSLDTAVYVEQARRVAAGDLLLGPEPYFLPPLYAYFLGAVFALSGSSLLAAKVVQILLGTAAVGLVYATAKRWDGLRAGLVAGALTLATGVLTFNEVLILQSALDPFLTALGLYLLSRALLARTTPAFLALGAALGAHALNRPNLLAWIGVLAAGLVIAWRNRTGLRCASALAFGAALAIAPITLRNRLVSGETILIASHGGLNFYIGNNADADGTFRSLAGIRPDVRGQAEDARRVVAGRLGREPGASEVSSDFYSRAWSWIRTDPLQALGLFARKLVYVFHTRDLALNYSYAYYAREEPTLLRVLIDAPWLLAPLGLVGLALRARERGDFRLWAAFVPVYALSVAAYFVSSRYRLPLLIPLAIGAALALQRLAKVARRRSWRELTFTAGAMAAVATLVCWDIGLDDGRTNERTQMVLHLIDSGRFDDARALTARARTLDRRRAGLDRRIGQAWLAHERPADALPHLAAADGAERRPDLAAYDLARAFAALGRQKEARGALRQAPLADADSRALLAIGLLAFDLEDAEWAAGVFERAIAREPGVALAHEKLGLARALQGRRAEAIAHLERARALEPANASVALNLAVLLAEEGRFAQARTLASLALRLRPDYPQARGLLSALEGR